MTCGPEKVLFRILDRASEWGLDLRHEGDIELDDFIQLAQVDPSAVDPSMLAGVMPPPWIAHGCAACEWYVACAPTVLRYGPCLDWVAIAGSGRHVELVKPVSVAATRDRVAVLDTGRRELLVLSAGGERVLASYSTQAQGPIAFWRTAIVAADHDVLVAFDLLTGEQRTLVHAAGRIARMVTAGTTLWIAIEAAPGALHLFYLGDDGKLHVGHLAQLVATARPTALTAATDDVACLEIARGGGEPRTLCIDRCGRPAEPPAPAHGPKLNERGIIRTAPDSPLDSGMPRCHWHRVRLDVELPAHTGVTVWLAAVENAADAVADEDWQAIDTPAAIRDFLIDQPPGRYLHVKIELRGDSLVTPKIQRIRLDFPRSTSVTRLPGIYREDPVAADFLDRFIATFDASIEDLDRVIARFPALLDPQSTPAEAFAWLATFFDIALDPAWSPQTRRNILDEAHELYRRRGTPWALSRAIELTTGTAPAIQELASSGMFARLRKEGRGFRLGEARLFGAARARMRLGSSQLGRAPLRSYGDPDRDYFAATGWRILVQLPGGGSQRAPDTVERLRRLVDTQKPAHVTAQIRVGGDLALVGVASAVGIDTRLGGLPEPYLGRNTYLRRRTALAAGGARGGAHIAVGVAAAIGIQTVLS